MKFQYLLIVFVFLLFSAYVGAQDTAPPALPVFTGTALMVPGDQVNVKVIGEDQYSFATVVDDEGRIEVPFDPENPVVAKCKTQRDVRNEISKRLSKYLKYPDINLQVLRHNPPATVYGEVNRPNEVELRRKATLVEVLAVVGGVKEEAGGTITVFRPVKPVCAEYEVASWRTNPNDPAEVPSKTFSVASLRTGSPDANPIIYPGDVVIVEKAAPVYITGEVVTPQGIYLKEGGTTLTQALAKIGGLRPGAKTKDIRIQRRKPNSNDTESISVDLDLIKAQKQPDPMLQPYDIVEVATKKDSTGVALLKFAIGLAKTGATSAFTGGGYRAVIY